MFEIIVAIIIILITFLIYWYVSKETFSWSKIKKYKTTAGIYVPFNPKYWVTGTISSKQNAKSQLLSVSQKSIKYYLIVEEPSSGVIFSVILSDTLAKKLINAGFKFDSSVLTPVIERSGELSSIIISKI